MFERGVDFTLLTMGDPGYLHRSTARMTGTRAARPAYGELRRAPRSVVDGPCSERYGFHSDACSSVGVAFPSQ